VFVLVYLKGLNDFDQHYNLLVEVVEMAGIDAFFLAFAAALTIS